MLQAIAHNQEDALQNLYATQNVNGHYFEPMNTLIRYGLVRKTAKRKYQYKLTTRGKEVLKYFSELDEKTDSSWTTSLSTVREMSQFCVCVTHQKKL